MNNTSQDMLTNMYVEQRNFVLLLCASNVLLQKISEKTDVKAASILGDSKL